MKTYAVMLKNGQWTEIEAHACRYDERADLCVFLNGKGEPTAFVRLSEVVLVNLRPDKPE